MDEQLFANANHLLTSAPGNVTLAAGHGKTHLIAAACAVAQHRSNRVLVLTHTNAGVDALRRTLGKLSSSGRLIRITTIDSWARGIARSFPTLAGATRLPPENSKEYWPSIRRAAINALANSHVIGMAARSYEYVFVDEYQDCNEYQHAIVDALAAVVPSVRIGDPLQSVYDFDKETDFTWLAATSGTKIISVTTQPWRWLPEHRELADFLIAARTNIENGHPICLDQGPESVKWHELSYPRLKKHCMQHVHSGESTVILVKAVGQVAPTALKFGGAFSVMEELEGSVILTCAAAIDRGGCNAAAAILAFAKDSFNDLPATLTGKLQAFESGNKPSYKASTSSGCLDALVALSDDSSPTQVDRTIGAIDDLAKPLYRREAWSDLKQSVRLWRRGESAQLSDAVRLVRDRGRGRGRMRGKRLVSTPLRVKGLECDHCIVLDRGSFTNEELYVAITRGTRTLTVISDKPRLLPK